MVLHSEDPAGKVHFTKDDLISAQRDKDHPKPFMEGKYLARWIVRRILYLEYGTRRAPSLCSRPTFPQFYEVPEKLISMDISGREARVAYDDQQLFHNHSAWSFVLWHHLKDVRNNSIKKSAKYQNEVKPQEPRPHVFREDLEKLSRQFEPKYLLAVMNSTFAREWLAARRRSKIHVYPDDWKPLPIVDASTADQAAIAAKVDAILALYRAHGHPLPAAAAEYLAELEVEIDTLVSALYEQHGAATASASS